MTDADARQAGRAANVSTVAALICTGLVLFVALRFDGMRDANARVLGKLERIAEGIMEQAVKVSTWYSKSANGVCILQVVSTPKGTMTDEEWQAAHRKAVADMQADFPPSADCPTPR